MSDTVDTSPLSPAAKRALLEQLMRSRASKPKFLPVSFAQQRLWFLDQMVPGNPFYNEHASVRLLFAIDCATLERSLREIVRRHAVLRTTFSSVDGQPVQSISPHGTIELPVIDLRALPVEQRRAEGARRASEDALGPFDLRTGPLLRTTLLRVDEAEYVFLVTMHHIVSDGWSMGVFARELEALYTASAAGRPSPLPDLPIQYADFAVWQRQWLQGRVLDEQLAYWTRQLAGAPTLQLPTDRPRPTVPSFHGAATTVTYSAKLLAALHRLAQRDGVTLFMTLLAGFQMLLARYTEQDDIVVGVPVAGRIRPELEQLIGFFVNTLVIRTSLEGDPSVSDVLARVYQVTVDAYAHQDLPFEKIVETLQPARDLSRNPLFQVAFQLFTPGPGDHEANSTFNPEVAAAKFDLVLHCSETDSGLLVRLEYSADLFDGPTIARLSDHYRQLLEGMVEDPRRRVSELPLLTPQERHAMQVWNDTRREYPREQCFHQLFEEQSARTPDAVAVSFGGEELTYRALNARANQVAAFLRTKGIGRDVLVAIAMERSITLVASVLGVLKSGGAYVPLDPAYPAERLAYMLDDTHAPLVLTEEALRDRLPPTDAEVVCLDTEWQDVATRSESDVRSDARPEDLAYVIYTSGSTGRPKGVMIEHRGLCNSLVEAARVIDGRPDSRVLQFSSFSFDGWIYEATLAFGAGAELCLAPREALIPGPVLVDHLREARITTALLPASTLAVLPEADLPDLRCLNVTGEACPPAVIARWARGRRLLNVYGPTEATCWCTHAEFTMPTTRAHVGRPMANAEIYILDSRLNPVPVGVPGELYIGGDGLARGYLNQEELTRERFIKHPFSEQPRARLYRSGDRARYLPSADIELLGRLDHQVKVRGFRIETGEIESVLAEHPGAHACVVVVRENKRGEQRLISYVVPQRGASVAVSDLRAFLQQRLPEYMIPSRIVLIASLPINSNGKLDRFALPDPDGERLQELAASVAPRTELERAIARVWQDVLALEQVSLDDNFFDSGGHSLLLAKLHSRLETVLPHRIPMIDLFRYPTIASLAAQFEEASAATPAPPADRLQPRITVHRARAPRPAPRANQTQEAP